MKRTTLGFNFTIATLLFVCGSLLSQDFGKDTARMSLLFIGDIMGHDSQIEAAWNDSLKAYNYDDVFSYIEEDLSAVDFAIANLEVTLAGVPYKGYPQFSSPDELAVAASKAGIDAFVTANNHSCDRGKNGIIRTVKVLDSLKIPHTGTFLDTSDRNNRNLLILEKNGIRAGILNYTYGTNGIPVPAPTMVNLIDREQIRKDAEAAVLYSTDVLIAFVHWGLEYHDQPDRSQEETAEFFFSAGFDYIIGSHPHVVQKSLWVQNPERDSLVVYSLGNFVSNMTKRKTDGGMMFRLDLIKMEGKTSIEKAGYQLTWVYRPVERGQRKFHILPCQKYERDQDFFTDPADYQKMMLFMNHARTLLNAENLNVTEIE